MLFVSSIFLCNLLCWCLFDLLLRLCFELFEFVSLGLSVCIVFGYFGDLVGLDCGLLIVV